MKCCSHDIKNTPIKKLFRQLGLELKRPKTKGAALSPVPGGALCLLGSVKKDSRCNDWLAVLNEKNGNGKVES
jgi:hypothetical protein